MGKTAIFPGSFDPFTIGHKAIVEHALGIFDKVLVGIGVNSKKQYLFSLEDRLQLIRQTFEDNLNVEAISFEGLTVDFCRKNDISCIVRGLRNTRDFQFEYEIAHMNRSMNSNIQTLFLPTLPEYSAINSTIVREIHRNGGDVSSFLPEGVVLPDSANS